MQRAFANSRRSNYRVDDALISGFQRVFGPASDDDLQNNLPFQVVQADNNAARLAENQSGMATAEQNIQALEAGMTEQFVASVNSALKDSFTSVDPQDYTASKQWQRTEMPRVIGEILKSEGLPFDEQSISIAMQILSQQ